MKPDMKMTRQEYIETVPTDGIKYEWVNGEAYAMAGGTPLHAAIAVNLVLSLGGRLRGRPCRPTTSDQRLFVRATDAYFYPDVMVVCPPWDTPDGDSQSVANPRVIIEVLSDSTRDYDTGSKFEHYRRIDSLTDFLAVDPVARRLTHYRRTEEGWLLTDVESGSVSLGSLEIDVPLDEVFADLEDVPGA